MKGNNKTQYINGMCAGSKRHCYDSCNLYFEFAPFDYECMRCKPDAKGYDKN